MIPVDGRACVEQYDGSVVAWERRTQGDGGDTHFNTHFHGDASGQFGFAAGNVEQTQHQGSSALEQHLQQLLDSVRQAAEAVDHPEAPRVLAYIDAIQAEAAGAEPDPARRFESGPAPGQDIPRLRRRQALGGVHPDHAKFAPGGRGHDRCQGMGAPYDHGHISGG